MDSKSFLFLTSFGPLRDVLVILDEEVGEERSPGPLAGRSLEEDGCALVGGKGSSEVKSGRQTFEIGSPSVITIPSSSDPLGLITVKFKSR